MLPEPQWQEKCSCTSQERRVQVHLDTARPNYLQPAQSIQTHDIVCFAMTSRSDLTYAARAELHPHPLAQRLFQIAEEKRSNLVFSADYTDAQSLLKAADGM